MGQEPNLSSRCLANLSRRRFVTGITAAGALWAIRQDDPVHSAAQAEKPAALSVQRLSWAGVKLELGDTTLLIDAWANPAIWEGAWKEPVVPVEVRTGARAALITHLHNDHFDQPTLRQVLGERGQVMCHSSIATYVASRGFRVWEVELYQPQIFGDFTVTAVPAVDGLGEDQVSWVVAGGGKRIIHCGDTLWHGRFWHIGRQFGPFDCAFLPINGAEVLARSPRSGVPAVMTPEQSVAAALVLGARLATPIHYGMHVAGSYLEYPNAESVFLRVARERGVAVQLMRPGEQAALEAKS